MTIARKLVNGMLAGILICFTTPLDVGSQSQSKLGDSFPMSQGTVWVYRGIVRWQDMEKQKRVSAMVTVRSEIVRIFHGDDFAAALLRGFPSDLDWSDGKAVAGDRLLVQTSGGDFHVLTDEAKFAEEMKRLESPSATVQDMFSDDDLFVKFPLKKGMKFCDAEAMKREDDEYCWLVANVHDVDLSDVKGLKPSKYRAFLMQYITNPDDTELEFVPGVGFISYRYHHHGSVADTEMRLVEYHAAKDASVEPGDTR